MSAVLALIMELGPILVKAAEAGINTYAAIQKMRVVVQENKVIGDPDWEAADAFVTAQEEAFDAAAKE